MKETPLKAVGYVRVSTSEQSEHGESLNTQKSEIERYCKYKNYELTRIFEDAGVSGAKESRPAFDLMMEGARQGAFSILVIPKFSRLARNARNLLNTYHTLDSLKVKLHSIGENFSGGDSAQSRFFMQMLGAVSELERETIYEQMHKNKMSRWRRHDIFNGRPPFGYSWSPEDKRLVAIPEQAAVYKRIVSMYLHAGLSLRDTALSLRAEGVVLDRTPSKKPGAKPPKPYALTGSTIGYILKNPVYLGSYVLNRHEYVDSQRSGKPKPDAQHIRFDADTLIDKGTWDRIQRRLSANKIKSRNAGDLRELFWLRNVCRCDECGGRIHPHRSYFRKDGSTIRYYRCYWSGCSEKSLQLDGKKRCHLPLMKADDLEAVVWSKIVHQLTFMTNKNKLKALLNPARFEKELAVLDRKGDALRGRLAKKAKARANLMLMLENLDMSDGEQESFARSLHGLEQETADLKNALLTIEQDAASLKISMSQSQEYAAFIEDQGAALREIVDRLSNLDPASKALVVNSMLTSPILVAGDKKEDLKAFHCRNIHGRISMETLQIVLDAQDHNGPNGPNGVDHLIDLVRFKEIFRSVEFQ